MPGRNQARPDTRAVLESGGFAGAKILVPTKAGDVLVDNWQMHTFDPYPDHAMSTCRRCYGWADDPRHYLARPFDL